MVVEDVETTNNKVHAILVGCDSDSVMMFAAQVTKKGNKDRYLVTAVKNFVQNLGLTRAVLQTDGESSLVSVISEVRSSVGFPCSTRKSTPYDPQSNGAAEGSVNILKGMIRTLTSVVNVNYQVRVGPRDWIFAWIVRHSAWLVSRFSPKGPQKRSAYQIVYGTPYRGEIVMMGETLMVKVIEVTKSKGKPLSLWYKGIFVGKEESTDNWLVATSKGIVASRTVRRIAGEGAWCKETFLSSGGLPWSMVKDVRTEHSNIPRLAPPIAPRVEPPPIAPPALEDAKAAAGTAAGQGADGAAAAGAASAPAADDDMSASSASSSSSSSSGQLAMEVGAGSGLKRDRESDGGSDEAERLERLAAICASLGGPHEDNQFAEVPLTLDEVAESRCRELKQLKEFGVFTEVLPSDLPPGTRIITTTWVDRRKSPSEVKSRICARDFNTGKRDDVFAATPGSASARLIDFISAKFGYRKLVGDVSAAFLHAQVPPDSWIVVRPPEGHETSTPGALWRLNRMLYGLRDAPVAWQNHLSDLLIAGGYRRGTFEPSLFWHPECQVYVLVHVDDLHVTGPDSSVRALMKYLEAELVLKSSGLKGEGDEYSFLKAVRGMTKDHVTLWPQDGYILETAKQLGLEEAKGASTPLAKLKGEDGDENLLSSELATVYRSAVGRLLYLSHSRFDIQYACRRLCQGMRAPTQLDYRQLRHLTRYLLKTRGVGLVFPRGGAGELEFIDVYVDSDWAGKDDKRKSTSGGCVLAGGCCLVSWARGQSVVAQSSGEAEFYAILAGAHEGLAVQSTLAEIGITLKLRVWSDSSAARTMCHRLGAGSLKHVETKHFHIQNLVSQGKLTIERISTDQNPGDLGTKAATTKMLSDKLHLSGLAEVRLSQGEKIVASLRSHPTVCLNVSVLQAVIGLLQCLQAKGEPDEARTSHGDWLVPVLMVSGVLFWVFFACHIVACLRRLFFSRSVPPTRTFGTQTEPEAPLRPAPVPPVLHPVMNVRLPDQVFIAPNTGQCYHVSSTCGGLGGAVDIVSRRLCHTCRVRERGA